MAAYMTSIDVSKGTIINNTTTISSVTTFNHFQNNISSSSSSSSVETFYPLVPDVTIHYRCGDNLRFDSAGYGLLPFHVTKYSTIVLFLYIHILILLILYNFKDFVGNDIEE